MFNGNQKKYRGISNKWSTQWNPFSEFERSKVKGQISQVSSSTGMVTYSGQNNVSVSLFSVYGFCLFLV